MSRGQTLRALVNERLAAAAEDIFVLFERTIVKYEEELCRSKEENQRKQQLLDKVLNPRIELVKVNVQIPLSPGPNLNQEITETPQSKEEPEEPRVKEEEELQPVPIPESSAVCVKTEESSLLQQRQTEHREEMQEEKIGTEPHFHWNGHINHVSNSDNDNWGPFCWPPAQMEIEADRDHSNQVKDREGSTDVSPQKGSVPETTVHSEHTWFVPHKDPGMDQGDYTGDEETNHQCCLCNKTFGTNQELESHIKIHTGETCGSEPPFHLGSEWQWKKHQCPFCQKRFAAKHTLQTHIRIHTGEKPYSCTVCNKLFGDSSDFRKHQRVHTGERPHSCQICAKTFSRRDYLNKHVRTHTGERPYSCSVCNKTFSQKCNLNSHMMTHSV